jgi:hypothetical protein
VELEALFHIPERYTAEKRLKALRQREKVEISDLAYLKKAREIARTRHDITIRKAAQI